MQTSFNCIVFLTAYTFRVRVFNGSLLPVVNVYSSWTEIPIIIRKSILLLFAFSRCFSTWLASPSSISMYISIFLAFLIISSAGSSWPTQGASCGRRQSAGCSHVWQWYLLEFSGSCIREADFACFHAIVVRTCVFAFSGATGTLRHGSCPLFRSIGTAVCQHANHRHTLASHCHWPRSADRSCLAGSTL